MIPGHSFLKTGDVVANGTETYEIVGQLHHNQSESSIYRIRCKTGRLRNRHLALKKSTPQLSAKSRKSTTTALHQALHHPNIVSLLSAFSTTRDDFHVLELCSMGNLFQFLQSRPQTILNESELRGVTKSLADALIYLRKELIVHGDVNPSNILLTGDYGLKLSNFKHSMRLPSRPVTTETSYSISRYAAPEIASGGSCSFSSDVWSLGCVMLNCLTGLPPFEAQATSSLSSKVVQTVNRLPKDLSDDVKALISRTLHIIPEGRIYVPDILSHPFLANDKPITSLRPIISNQKPFGDLLNIFDGRHQPNFGTFPASAPRHTSDHLPITSRNRERLVLANIGNLELRTALSDEITALKATRRVVSDPARRKITFSPLEALDSYCETPAPAFPPRANVTAPISRIRTGSQRGVPEPSEPISFETVTAETVHRHKDLEKWDVESIKDVPTMLPIGTERPTPLNTLGMSCQSHKTAYGQITILPSHSLLVDFRESQRRKGLKGDEVLLIESNGLKISIYSAPHLSSPSCLVEATQQYLIQELPSVYWKQYNDATRLVDQIKQRTPVLVVHLATAKCTLMANAPEGEIEILLAASSSSQSKVQTDGHFLRIRFSRQNKSIEIARHISGTHGEEWKKKTVVSISQPPYISAKDWKFLEQDEKEALNHLTQFLKISDTVEELMNTTPALSPLIAAIAGQDSKKNVPPVELSTPGLHPPHSRTPTITSRFSSFNFPPRPSKLSTTTSTILTPDLTLNSHVAPLRDSQVSKAEGVFSDTKRSWLEDTDMVAGGQEIQTRFIPSVGWCIRYASSVSQGGRYRIMFFDGVALDIDVDEDWVEFRSQSGEITVYNIRECSSKRKISERMKVFEEFVSLFDDSQV